MQRNETQFPNRLPHTHSHPNPTPHSISFIIDFQGPRSCSLDTHKPRVAPSCTQKKITSSHIKWNRYDFQPRIKSNKDTDMQLAIHVFTYWSNSHALSITQPNKMFKAIVIIASVLGGKSAANYVWCRSFLSFLCKLSNSFTYSQPPNKWADIYGGIRKWQWRS